MALEGPCFPVSVDSKQVSELLSSLVKGKGWQAFSIDSISLSMVPYWFFNYNAFIEQSRGEVETVSEELSGLSALDAVRGELDENIGLLSESSSTIGSKKLDTKEKYTLVSPVISREEARDLARIKTAKSLGTGKDNIIVSGARLYNVPVYDVSFSCEAGSFNARLEAVTGGFLGEDPVPFKEKTREELARESFSEFFYPRTWAHYLWLMVKRVFSFLALLPWKSPWFWALILVIVLLYVLFYM